MMYKWVEMLTCLLVFVCLFVQVIHKMSVKGEADLVYIVVLILLSEHISVIAGRWKKK